MQTVGSVAAGEYNSGTSTAYTSGDLVGVWVEVNGVTYYSVNALNSSIGSYQYTEGYGVDAVAGTAAVWFDDGILASAGGVGNLGEGWPGQDLADIKILVTGSALTAGSPLPGVLATMVMCGVVGGYFRRKKSAKK